MFSTIVCCVRRPSLTDGLEKQLLERGLSAWPVCLVATKTWNVCGLSDVFFNALVNFWLLVLFTSVWRKPKSPDSKVNLTILASTSHVWIIRRMYVKLMPSDVPLQGTVIWSLECRLNWVSIHSHHRDFTWTLKMGGKLIRAVNSTWLVPLLFFLFFLIFYVGVGGEANQCKSIAGAKYKQGAAY